MGEGTVHPKYCLEGLLWSSPISHMQCVRKWALIVIDWCILGLTHCCIIPVLYSCVTMEVTSELFISVSHQGSYWASSRLINWVPFSPMQLTGNTNRGRACVATAYLLYLQDQIIQSLVKYRLSPDTCRLVTYVLAQSKLKLLGT